MAKINTSIAAKFFFLLVLLWIIDSFAGYLLYNLYKSSVGGIAYQEYYIMNKTNQEVLVFGPSTAAYHYIPDIICDELNSTVYNAGREGAGIFFQYGVLLSTLKRYKPELIILDLNFRDIYARGGSFSSDALLELTPFYGKINLEFDSLLQRNWYDEILFQSNLIKYNGKFFSLITGNLAKGRLNQKGYRPLHGNWTGEKGLLIEKDLKVDQELLSCLEKFISKIQKNNINLVIVASPVFMSVPSDLYKPIDIILNKYDIPFLNYLQDSAFISDQVHFNDIGHLNSNGARKFSLRVSKDIRNLLIKSEANHNNIFSTKYN